MPAVLNTNMASLYAQKNLSTAQSDLATSVQRLSSGKRINSAKDDAAGYAVSEAIASNKNVTDQSIQNTQNAISQVQTAEGALDVVGKMLQRALTLATEKEDTTLTTGQTASINNEMTALLNEISQIKSRTRFQGGAASIFNSTQSFTTGSGQSSPTTTKINIGDLSLSSLSIISSSTASVGVTAGTAFTVTGATAGAAINSKIFVNGIDSGATVITNAITAGTNSVTASGNLTVAVGDTVTFGSATAISSSSSSADLMNAVQTNTTNRATLGTYQNQLNYIVDNLQTLSNNLADAKSRIVDTNYAAETANLTRGQILQQAATSMLAQANQMPNVILTLLK